MATKPGQLLVACIVPLRTDARAIADAVGRVKPSEWDALSLEIATQQSISQDVNQAVATVFREQTWPTARRVARDGIRAAKIPGTSNWGSCPGCSPQQLQGMTVTAGYNYSMIDHWVVSKLFSQFGGEHPVAVDWYLVNEWRQQCEDYNQAYWTWYQTRDQVAANANDVANDIEALADQMEAAVLQLETADNSCERVAGKPVCIDFFIMNCTLLLVGEGDCRGFDPDAKFSNSRVQMYLNPETKIWEVIYNCTRFVVAGQPVVSMCDSAAVFDPTRDVHVTSTGTDAFLVEMQFLNNACASIPKPLCPPPINASVNFTRNAAAPGGWQVNFVRDGFPSMGIYSRNATDTGFDVVKEDPQKTRNGINAMRALAGQIRSEGSNVPPPDNPNECEVS
ncbi:MAG: hypothetical protein ABIT20_16640 [Gemmatimonadaceae bacterium]